MDAQPYRKKPVVIEALQWTGDNIEDIKRFVHTRSEGSEHWAHTPGADTDCQLSLYNTMERQWIDCPVNHWVMRGVKDEFYPCDPEIFEATYDIVTPPHPSLYEPVELMSSGVLWLINRTVFHPRGYAMALHFNESYTELLGWTMEGDGAQPWAFFNQEHLNAAVEAGADPDKLGLTDEDAAFKAVEALFTSHSWIWAAYPDLAKVGMPQEALRVALSADPPSDNVPPLG